MLVRIVRMEIAPESRADFEIIYYSSGPKVRGFYGCQHLELLTDLEKPNVFYTISHWNSADDLANYRKSALFKETWAAFKKLFTGKPIALSLENLNTIDSPNSILVRSEPCG